MSLPSVRSAASDNMTLDPGIHYDIPDADYRALPYESHSGLQAWVSGKKRNMPKSIRQPGCLVETMLLELDALEKRYFKLDGDKGEEGHIIHKFSTKEGRAWLADQTIKHKGEGKEPVRKDDYEKAVAMAASLCRNLHTSRLLATARYSQVTVIADLCGVRCKARLDMVIEHNGIVIADVKTTSAMSADDFAASTVKYGYASQAAMYCDAYETASGGVVPREHYLLCVSKTARDDDYNPLVWRVRMTADMLAHGRRWYQDMLTVKGRANESQ